MRVDYPSRNTSGRKLGDDAAFPGKGERDVDGPRERAWPSPREVLCWGQKLWGVLVSSLPRNLDDLIACPQCDALYRAKELAHGERSSCLRCHTQLIAPRKKAGMIIIMLSLSIMILIGGALWFPFLEISRSGFRNSATLIDAALAFSDGLLVFLSLSVLAMIVLIPLLRVMLVLYVLTPLVFDKPPRAHARPAFRLSEALRPWSMAEIFALGCAVSLVKVADLARIDFGPAFWMFASVVVIIMVQDRYMCRWSVWTALDEDRA